MVRLFVPDPLARDADITPTPEQGHYLTKVMRLGLGAEVLLFNGRDGEWRAAVTEARCFSSALRWRSWNSWRADWKSVESFCCSYFCCF